MMQARRRIRPRVVGATWWNKCRYLLYIRQPEIAVGPSDSFQAEQRGDVFVAVGHPVVLTGKVRGDAFDLDRFVPAHHFC